LFTKPVAALTQSDRGARNGAMNTGSIVIALAAAAAAFAVAVVARPAGSAVPPSDVFPLFAGLIALESIAFGAGVAYIVRARRALVGAGIGPLERAVAWSVAYLLLAPWPHDYLHALTHINGVYDWPALAGIEYVFHLGIVPVGVVVAAYFTRRGELRRA
jgi:hypothetical protein